MSNDITRRRLLASTGVLASGLALGGTVGATSRNERSALDELPLRWTRTYDVNRVNSAVASVEHDDQYVLLGATGSSQEQTGWLFGVDATTGDGLWQTTVENTDLESQPSFQQIVPAVDGDGFVLLGTSVADSTFSLVRTTADGEIEWWEVYEPDVPEDESPTVIAQDLVAVDGGYVFGGYRVQDAFDAFSIRVDADGAVQSRRTFFDEETSTLLGMVATGDGGYVAVGELQEVAENDSPPVRANAFRVDGNDEILWQQEFTAEFPEGEQGQSQLQDVTATEDGFVAGGNAIAEGASEVAGWVVRVDSSGAEQARGQHSPEAFTLVAAVATSDDGTVVAGQAQESLTGSSQGWVGEVDDAVELNWDKTVSHDDITGFNRAMPTSDDGIALVGQTSSDSQNADPQSRALLTKLGGAEAPSVTPTATPSEDGGGTTTETTTAEATDEVTTTAAETETTETTPTPTTEPTPTATATATATAAETTTTADDGPGFGVGVTVAALGAGALLRHGTRTTEADEE